MRCIEARSGNCAGTRGLGRGIWSETLEGNSVRSGRGRCYRGLAQVAHGVDRSAVDANFVVNVWAGGSSADAYIADRVPAPQLLPDEHVEARKMAVIRGYSKSVIDDHQPPVSRAFVSPNDHAVR